MLMHLIVQQVDMYTFIIFIYVLLSWIPTKQGVLQNIDEVLGKLCDPYLDLFKRFIPPLGGMVAISPLVAIVVLQLVVRVLYFIF